MLTVKTGQSSQAVLQGAKHVLFVEGTKQGLDVTVLGELLSPGVRVEPLGSSFQNRAAAQALHEFHPNYWFVIDRDALDDDMVEASWAKFPDPTHDNLLIWRRRELESYFLEPGWLAMSRYLKPKATRANLQAWIERRASGIVWLAAANRVLESRRDLARPKDRTTDLLTKQEVQGLERQDVEERLVSAPVLERLRELTAERLSKSSIRNDYQHACGLLSGGTFPLVFGTGRWRDLIPAKVLYHDLVNQWFAVPDLASGKPARLTGVAAQRAVAVDLLKNHQGQAPADLQQLKRILDDLTRSPLAR